MAFNIYCTISSGHMQEKTKYSIDLLTYVINRRIIEQEIAWKTTYSSKKGGMCGAEANKMQKGMRFAGAGVLLSRDWPDRADGNGCYDG